MVIGLKWPAEKFTFARHGRAGKKLLKIKQRVFIVPLPGILKIAANVSKLIPQKNGKRILNYKKKATQQCSPHNIMKNSIQFFFYQLSKIPLSLFGRDSASFLATTLPLTNKT